MSNIVIISGSPLSPSRSAALSAYMKNKLVNQGMNVSMINIRDLPPEDLMHANFKSPSIKEAMAKVDGARAVIVASPVYKATYTGLLKSFFDLIPEKGLANKIILPVASGGSIAHLLALEYAFNPLFSILGAQEIINGVYLVDSQLQCQDNEVTFLDSDVEQRLNTAVEALINKCQVSDYINK